jgi:hypothetical protein
VPLFAFQSFIGSFDALAHSCAKTRYLKAEKIVLALVSTSRKLKPYFQTHQIIVLMDQPLQQILHKLNMFG